MNLLYRMQELDGALAGAEVEVVILRQVTNNRLCVEDVVFEGIGPLEDVIRMAWGKLGAGRSESGCERRKRSILDRARSARQGSTTSAGELAALAALAPDVD